MKTIRTLALLSLLGGTALPAQQVPDLDFEPRVSAPRHAPGRGPVVGIDGAHNNLHTLSTGFAPLARLLTADGYVLRPVQAITESGLDSLRVLVIANPLQASNVGNWTLPTPSAFSPDEIRVISQWVAGGGRLWLIADHMPFAGAAAELASTFGFEFRNGFVMSERQGWPPERYVKGDGTLASNALTQGIDSLAGFTGSALWAPPEATSLGRFPATHRLLLPQAAWQFAERTRVESLDGLTFGAVRQFGEGRIAIFTEAAMFTAQLLQGSTKVGFTSPVAPHNQAFALSVMHWLDGVPDTGRPPARAPRAKR